MTGVPASQPPPGVATVAPPRPGATRVVLIRHGEATCNVAGLVGGRAGCSGLTGTGRRQAQALRTRLLGSGELADVAALYTSVLPRALETAEIVFAGTGLEHGAVADCALCELHPGEADGLTWEEFRARYGEPDFDADPDQEVAPGGESWRSFVARASGALARVAEAHPSARVAVVCHGGVIEASLTAFLPVAPGRPRLGLLTEHTSLTEWERSGDRWRLLRYNDAAHLRPGPG